MSPDGFNIPSMILAGLAAGVWIFVSGLLMAGSFGYRDMKAAFDSVGLRIPMGAAPFIVHTLVRLCTGMALVALYVVMSRLFSPMQAVFAAAGFTWLLGVLLPFVVIAQWGLFPWSVAAKLWAWDAAELLIAAMIGRLLYHP
jgi:hypothetical protein